MTLPAPSSAAPLLPASMLLTVTGRDHPGIVARLTGLLAQGGAQLLDVEQVVVQGQLTLCLLVRLPETRSLLAELLYAAKELGVALDFRVLDPVPAAAPPARGRYVATLVGRGLGSSALHALATCLAEHGGNIEQVSRLTDGELAPGGAPQALESSALAAVEVRLTLAPGASAEPLKRALLQLAMGSPFDIALQREGLYRRSKRMVVMDMDSTLIRIEVIDELARAHGVYEQVSHITERAMHGEMDYDESLRQRVALLEGLPVRVLRELAASLPLTEGAETLVRVLKRLGFRTAVISGGFSVAAEALQARLGIDSAFSNVLEEQDGKLTGRTVGPIVNARRKAELLEQLAREQGLLLDQVIAVGDGANDLLMLQRAGLGIAFRAKPKLREAADTSISAGGLDTILYLLGLSARELQEVG